MDEVGERVRIVEEQVDEYIEQMGKPQRRKSTVGYGHGHNYGCEIEGNKGGGGPD